MHVVPQGYLEGFAACAPDRREPAIWRFERSSGQTKLLGIRDAEVRNDIYLVFGEDGSADTVIEDQVLVGVEGGFCASRQLLQDRSKMSDSQWMALAWFVAVQLLRTPRAFDLVRRELAAHGVSCDADGPPKIMIIMVRHFVRWLCRMQWLIGYNESDLPFVTGDNPVSLWREREQGFELGVGFRDPDLRVTCPFGSTLSFLAVHTEDSLRAVVTDPMEADPPSGCFRLRITGGPLPTSEIKKLNLVTVGNANAYVYADHNDNRLQRFLQSKFFGMPPQGFSGEASVLSG